jgi:hypothetical protein
MDAAASPAFGKPAKFQEPDAVQSPLVVAIHVYVLIVTFPPLNSLGFDHADGPRKLVGASTLNTVANVPSVCLQSV